MARSPGVFGAVDRGFGKIAGNKKAPLRVLVCVAIRGGDQRDPGPSIAEGRRTRPALARWRFSKIRSGFRVMIVAGRVEEGAHSAREVAPASTRHGWDAASGRGKHLDDL